MMKFTIALALLLSVYYSAQYSQFDAGFQQGFKDGFCYQKSIDCILPVLPLTPLPGINENLNNYKDGYHRGFLLGQNNSTQQNQFDRNAPRKYPEYVEPYNLELLEKTLRDKQKQYYSIKQKEAYYKNVMAEAINNSKKYYSDALVYLSQYRPLFRNFLGYINDVEKLNPQFIFNKSSSVLTFSAVENLIREINKNNRNIEIILLKANAEVQDFANNPNNIISGIYVADTYELQVYNNVLKKYEKSKMINGVSYIQFDKNFVIFKLADDAQQKFSALQYIPQEDIFYTGHDEIMKIDMDKMILNWYWKDENSKEYNSVFELKRKPN